MYKTVWNWNAEAVGGPLVAVKEHWDATIAFWMRAERPIGAMMNEAIDRVFDRGFREHFSKLDAIMESVYAEWHALVAERYPHNSADIRRNYPFRMHVIAIPPAYSAQAIRIKQYDECGEITSPVQDKDTVAVTWAATTGEIDSEPIGFDARQSEFGAKYGAMIRPGVLCFSEDETLGTPDGKARLISLADQAAGADGEGSAGGFDGSFLLIADPEKTARYVAREWETAPVIRVHKGFGTVFAFCARLGAVQYHEMDLLQGMRFSIDEYFEITEVGDAHIKFTVKVAQSDVKNAEYILRKGETATYRYLTEEDVSYSDGSELSEEASASVILSWA